MSYENETRKMAEEHKDAPGRINISTLKYLWQCGPFGLNREENLPKFLARMSVLQQFSDNELRIFAKYLHERKFQAGEVIFRQGDPGYGLYFVFKGSVSIVHSSGHETQTSSQSVTKIERGQYFGEMGLLEEYNRRSVSATCDEPTIILGLFKPDLEALLDQYPVVGAKFMREVSIILAQRINALVSEVSMLRHRLDEKTRP